MNYTIEEFKPLNTELTIDNVSYFYSPLTLHHEVIFINLYGSIPKMLKKLSDEPTEIFKISWQLIDQSRFNYNYAEFLKVLTECNEEKIELGKKLNTLLNQSIAQSQPLIKNIKRYKESQEIAASKSESKPCYAVYYDRLAKRYSYTIDQFYSLTLRQVHILLKTSEEESYKELEIEAALRDKKLKDRPKYEDIPIEQEQQQEAQAIDAMKRLKAAHKLGVDLNEYDEMVRQGKV